MIYNKCKVKDKGFTLIELLAVIIILGILMIIAIPAVTNYIQDSRKESYVSIAKEYINGTRNKVNSGEFKLYEIDTTYYIPTTCISLERGGESPFGNFDPAYIVVTYSGKDYDYYFTGRDTSSMGIYLTYEDLLNKESIKSGVKKIDTTIAVGYREKIVKLTNTCTLDNAEQHVATGKINDNEKMNSSTPRPLKPSLYDEIVSQNEENGVMVLDSVASTYVSASTGIDFKVAPSDTNGKGVYVRNGTESSTYPIYYYRGAVTNNNVIFAGFCWKIVRTTETGGIKLIYNGVPTAGTCDNTGNASQIGTSAFNSSYNYNAYVGYMYGTPNSSTYAEEHLSTKTTTSSTIKTYIDTWYSNNMTGYTSYLEDTIWCNDRTITPYNNVTGTGAGTTLTYYSAYTRNIYESMTGPILECVNQNDRFTVEETIEGRVEGNGALTYPVALLTADEITIAGQGHQGYSSTNYLYTGKHWWSLSPFDFYNGATYVLISRSNVYLGSNRANNALGVRPSLSLKHVTKIAEDGDGSVTNPFVVE